MEKKHEAKTLQRKKEPRIRWQGCSLAKSQLMAKAEQAELFNKCGLRFLVQFFPKFLVFFHFHSAQTFTLHLLH